MGQILETGLVRVQKLMTNISAQSRAYLFTLVQFADDNTDETYNYELDRQNYIGANIFKSKSGLAKEWGIARSTLRGYFREWIEGGWIICAKDVRALDNNPTFENWMAKHNGRGVEHYVFNVSMYCRLLDVLHTMNVQGLDMSDGGVKELIAFALVKRPDDAENPPVKKLYKPGYEPRLLARWRMVKQEGPPDKWEDLYEPKKESAGQGAVEKVEIGVTELPAIDYTTLEQKFAKQHQNHDKYSNLAYELPLRLEFADPEDESKRLELSLDVEHINDDGHLDPARLKGNPGVRALKQRAAVLKNEVEKQRMQHGDGEIEVNTFMADWDNDNPDEVEEARRLLESFNRRFSDVLMDEQQHALH